MTTYSQARAAIVTALKAGEINAFDSVPERATPPLAFLDADDPYITRAGATFGGEIVHYRVVLVVRAGANEVITTDVDDLITTALDALDANPDLIVGDVGVPGAVPMGGQNLPGVVIKVAIEIHR